MLIIDVTAIFIMANNKLTLHSVDVIIFTISDLHILKHSNVNIELVL